MHVYEDKENVAPRREARPTPTSSSKKLGERRNPLAPRRPNATFRSETCWTKARAHTWTEEVEAFLSREEVGREEESVRLSEELFRDPKDPRTWKAFLSHAEGKIHENEKDAQMLKLFAWAKDTVPTSGNRDCEDYIYLWIGFARRQMLRNENDASETFQSLKLNRIGERSAALYVEWARLELRMGDLEKAKKRIKSGFKADAVPLQLLERMRSELDNVRPCRRLDAPPPSATPRDVHSSQTHPKTVQSQSLTSPRMLASASQQVHLTSTPVAAQRMGSTPCASSATPTSFFLSSRRLQDHLRHRPPAAQLEVRRDKHESSSSGGGQSDGSSARGREARQTPCEEESVALFKTNQGPDAGLSVGRKHWQGSNSACTIPGNHTEMGTTAKLCEPYSAGLVHDISMPASNLRTDTNKSTQERILLSGGPRLSSKLDCPSAAELPGNVPVVGLNGRVVKGDETLEGNCLEAQNASASQASRNGHHVQLQDERLRSVVRGAQSVKPIDHHMKEIGSTIKPATVTNATDAQSIATMRSSDGARLNVKANGSWKGQEEVEGHKGILASEQLEIQRNQISNLKAETKADAPKRAVEHGPVLDRGKGGESVAPAVAAPQEEQTIVVHGRTYTVLECVGKGGSSKVFKVMAANRKIYALKRIRLSNRDKEAAAGFIDEITLLRRLRGHHNIIQLIDAEVIAKEGLILMVLEYGDIDLARLLQKRAKTRRDGEAAIDDNFLRLYWQQMLEAVQTIHKERIVHSDLKPANFLFVEGQLKLIDFGIAKAMKDNNTTSIMRESQVGTLNYMSPESILSGNGGTGAKVGRPSDVWALGCIFYQMIYGHTPFSHLPFIQKLHAITDANHKISYPPVQNMHAMDVMKRCLDRNPRARITIPELLEHPFLHPEAAMPACPGNGISVEQLQMILSHLTHDLGDEGLSKASQEILQRISDGQAVDLSSMIKDQGRNKPCP